MVGTINPRSELHALAYFDAEERLAWSSGVSGPPAEGRAGPRALRGASRAQVLAAWIHRMAWVDADAVEAQLGALGSNPGHVDVHTVDGRFLRLTQYPVPDGGLLLAFIDRTDDDRQLRALNDALQTARAANASKAELIGSLIHELRTPLQAMLGFAQLMQRDLAEPLPRRHERRVAEIVKGGEHLIHLIEDLSDLAQMERGQVAVRLAPTNAIETVQSVGATLVPIAAQARVEVSVKTCDADVPLVLVDRVRLTQILMHLGSNAIKYNRPLGSVSFAVSLARPDRVRISVTDTGMGIAEHEQPKIFQPLQSASRQGAAGEGTGMGLARSARLAHLMNCNIGFSSAWQRGSEFWIDVPAHLPRP